MTSLGHTAPLDGRQTAEALVARLAAVVLGVLLIALPAGARSADADLCDALAGDDPALGLTVPLETIDAAPALAACMAAVEQDPAGGKPRPVAVLSAADVVYHMAQE